MWQIFVKFVFPPGYASLETRRERRYFEIIPKHDILGQTAFAGMTKLGGKNDKIG